MTEADSYHSHDEASHPKTLTPQGESPDSAIFQRGSDVWKNKKLRTHPVERFQLTAKSLVPLYLNYRSAVVL